MYHLKYIVTTIFFVFFIKLLTSCGNNTKTKIEQSYKNSGTNLILTPMKWLCFPLLIKTQEYQEH
jgi:hypothetical protein